MGREFRTDIEGLRAICLLAVIAFHSFPNLLSGGFIGVDVFFVISGFLITRLLLREFSNTQHISLLNFWQRRITRILPAASFVLLNTIVLSLLIPGFDASAFSRDVFAATFFYYNARQAWHSVDYLGEPQDHNPLLHYWSLSVEEQFYLLWPLLLLVFLSLTRRSQLHARMLLVFVVVLLSSSFLYSSYLVHSAPAWGFFGTQSRAWQLLSGALVAATEGMIRLPGRMLAELLSLLGVALLTLSFALISGRDPYPGLFAFGPTFGAALLIYVNAGQGTWVFKALSEARLRFIGRISFSWYLWHWPMLIVGRQLLGNQDSITLALIVVSFFLAWFTFNFIEQPCRKGTILTKPFAAYSLAIGLLTSTALAGAYLRFRSPDRILIADNVYASISQLRRDRPKIYEDRCLLRFGDVQSLGCEYGALTSKRKVVLLGDSHAGNWFEPLKKASLENDWRLLVRIKASCRPLMVPQMVSEGGRERPYSECSEWLQSTLKEIAEIRPDLIIVAGTRNSFPVDAEQQMFARLSTSTRNLVIMRDTPWFPENAVDCLRTKGADQCQWSLEELLLSGSYPHSSKEQLPRNAQILDMNKRVCAGGVCRAVKAAHVVMFDSHHLSASFSTSLSGAFGTLLQEYSSSDVKSVQ